MNILHLLTSPAWGGLEIYASELIARLNEQAATLAATASTAATPAAKASATDFPSLSEPLSPPQEKVQHFVMGLNKSRSLEFLKFRGVKVFEIGSYHSKWKSFWMVRKILNNHQIDVIHSHTRKDLWTGALAAASIPPFSKQAHIYNLYMNALPKKDFVHQWLFEQVNYVCSSSSIVLDEASRNWPIHSSKLHLIRYGRDLTLYDHARSNRRAIQSIREIKNAENKIVFGTLARLDQGKGILEIAQSLLHLSEEERKKIQVWIIGERSIVDQTPQGEVIYEKQSQKIYDELKKLSQSSELKDILFMEDFKKDYFPYLGAMDVYILASHCETYSLSVVDALLMKKPVIGTDSGGTPEQIQAPQRGIIVPPKDSRAIAHGIRFYLNHPQQIADQGERGFQWAAQQHDWVQTLKNTYQLYHKCRVDRK